MEGAPQPKRIGSLLKEISGVLFPFTLVLLGTAIALYVLGQLPGIIFKPPPQQYQSVEEAEADLEVDIFVPAYSPEYLVWLPTAVGIQRQPVLMTIQSISSRREGDGMLYIRQAISKGTLPEVIFTLRKVEVQSPVSFDGKTAILLFGEGEDGRWYNEVRWRDGDHYLILTMTANYPLAELLRIAGSMR